MSEPLDVVTLRKALAAQGLKLRPEDEAATLATARFLQQSAQLVREAKL